MQTTQAPQRSFSVTTALLLLACSCVSGCAQPAGPVFPFVENAPVFPPLPDAPRIRYVGSLSTEADLKAAKSPLASLGEVLFGKNSVRSMLSPYAVYANGSRVFVCDSNAQVVHAFDLETRAYAQWRPDSEGSASTLRFSQPIGITADPEGRLYVSDSVAATIFIFDPSGRCLGDIGFGTLKRPSGIAFDAAGDRLLVVDTGHHQLLVLSPEGTLIKAVGTRGSVAGEFNFPTNVTIDRAGRIYVSDTLNFRVQVFDRDFQTIRQIGRLGDMPGYFAQPKGVAIDSDNHLYVVDAQFEAIQLFNAEGQLLMTFGEEGSQPGQFWLPAGIFIDLNDRIWVADAYNRRVQVFDYLSEFEPPENNAGAGSDFANQEHVP
jgi:DNA-binding beta-propeller fold protein YncE